MGTQLPSPTTGRTPNFRPMSVAKWLDGSRCHLLRRYRPQPRRVCVWWGPSSPRKKGTAPLPIFDPCLLWLNGWIDEDATWYGSRPRPRPHCVRGRPSSLPSLRETGTAAPLFTAHVYCGHGRPSQLVLSCCCTTYRFAITRLWNHLPYFLWCCFSPLSAKR